MEKQLAEDIVKAHNASLTDPKLRELPLEVAAAKQLMDMGWVNIRISWFPKIEQ